jgi:hypothetical protein
MQGIVKAEKWQPGIKLNNNECEHLLKRFSSEDDLLCLKSKEENFIIICYKNDNNVEYDEENNEFNVDMDSFIDMENESDYCIKLYISQNISNSDLRDLKNCLFALEDIKSK